MILTFDPGITTGWVTYDKLEAKYQVGELPEDLAGIYRFMNATSPDEVAFEMFKHRPGQGHALLYSVQVIGVIRLWCQHNKISPESYLPAETMKFWTDDKIRKLGLWTPGKGHAMDAMRVMLRYREDYDPVWKRTVYRKLRAGT